MEQTHLFTNELIHETSPYLLQHAHNPVSWESISKAKEENKLNYKYWLCRLSLVSCDGKESFEDVAVAKYECNFVCIKVDREERPDVDQVYMTAAQLLTGSGGCPECTGLSGWKTVFCRNLL
jgi:uncharacterized protein YyaL (SSP411 family)